MGKWVKTWGYPSLAILISLGSVLITYMIYHGNTEHTMYVEIQNKIIMLDSRIQRAIYTTSEDNNEAQSMIIEAIDLRDQAEKSWNMGRYSEADEFIQKAYEIIENLPIPKQVPPAMPPARPPVDWWLIGGIIAGLVAVAMVVWLTITRYRTGE